MPRFRGQNIMNQAARSNDLHVAKQAPPSAAAVETNIKPQQQAAPLGYQPETNRVEQKQVPLQGQQPILNQPSADAVKQNPIDTNSQKDRAQKDIVEKNHEDRGIKKDFKREIPAPAQIGGRDLKS